MIAVLSGTVLLIESLDHRLRQKSSAFIAGILLLLLILMQAVFVATWDNPVDDRQVYRAQFAALAVAPTPFASRWSSGDPLYLVYAWLMGRLGVSSPDVFLGVTGFVIAAAIAAAIWQTLGPWPATYGTFTLLCSGLLSAYGGIVLRQGLAMALLFLALSCLARPKVPWGRVVALAVACCLMHWSSTIAVILVAAVRVSGWSVRRVTIIWGLMVVAFLIQLPHRLFALVGLSSERLDKYTSASVQHIYGGGGYRLDFLLASVVLACLLLGLSAYTRDGTYEFLLKSYLALNAIFLAFGYAAFSDRLASYSWFLGLVAFWFPLVQSRRKGPHLVLALACSVIFVYGISVGTLSRMH